jgi:hypothetical protein
MNENKTERPDAMPADGASRQSAGSGRYTDFPAASPESNVNPPGAPQSSHGSATEPVAGGTEGAARAGESVQSGMGATAAGGSPGTRQGVLTPDDTAATADRGSSRRDG